MRWLLAFSLPLSLLGRGGRGVRDEASGGCGDRVSCYPPPPRAATVRRGPRRETAKVFRIQLDLERKNCDGWIERAFTREAGLEHRNGRPRPVCRRRRAVIFPGEVGFHAPRDMRWLWQGLASWRGPPRR